MEYFSGYIFMGLKACRRGHAMQWRAAITLSTPACTDPKTVSSFTSPYCYTSVIHHGKIIEEREIWGCGQLFVNFTNLLHRILSPIWPYWSARHLGEADWPPLVFHLLWGFHWLTGGGLQPAAGHTYNRSYHDVRKIGNIGYLPSKYHYILQF